MKYILSTIVSIVILSLNSCTIDEKTVPNTNMSILAFVVADNDLDDHSLYVERDLISGLKGCPAGTEIIIYMDRLDKLPTLKRYTLTKDGKVGINNIKEYPEQCSTSPLVFSSVLSDMRSNVSGKRFGLIYWSHGSGWLQNENNKEKITRAIGMDGGVSMDVVDMANIISSVGTAAFTVLDACFMGCAPVAYEMRNVTDYLIASPTNLPGVGFCYSYMLPDLLECTEESLARSLEIFKETNKTNVYDDSASFAIASVIKCCEMDSLAVCMHDLVRKGRDTLNINGIQSFDFDPIHLYYDLKEYSYAISFDDDCFDRFERQLDRAVIKNVYTSQIWSMDQSGLVSKPITAFCGMSDYIPGSANGYYDRVYQQTSWYGKVYE